MPLKKGMHFKHLLICSTRLLHIRVCPLPQLHCTLTIAKVRRLLEADNVPRVSRNIDKDLFAHIVLRTPTLSSSLRLGGDTSIHISLHTQFDNITKSPD